MNKTNMASKLKLKRLSISNNRLSDEPLSVLCYGLKTTHPNLKMLDLSK